MLNKLRIDSKTPAAFKASVAVMQKRYAELLQEAGEIEGELKVFDLPAVAPKAKIITPEFQATLDAATEKLKASPLLEKEGAHINDTQFRKTIQEYSATAAKKIRTALFDAGVIDVQEKAEGRETHIWLKK